MINQKKINETKKIKLYLMCIMNQQVSLLLSSYQIDCFLRCSTLKDDIMIDLTITVICSVSFIPFEYLEKNRTFRFNFLYIEDQNLPNHVSCIIIQTLPVYCYISFVTDLFIIGPSTTTMSRISTRRSLYVSLIYFQQFYLI